MKNNYSISFKEQNFSRLLEWLLVILSIMFFFQNIIQDFFHLFSAYDEFFTILVFIFFLVFIKRTKVIRKIDIVMLVLIILLCLIGFAGNYLSGGQPDYFAQLLDVISNFRFIIVYIALVSIFREFSVKVNLRRVLSSVLFILRPYIIMLFILALLNLFININMSYDFRYGMRSFAFIYKTPGLILNQMTYCLMLLLAFRKIKRSRIDILFILMVLLVMISTLRFRAFGIVAIFILLEFLLRKIKVKNFGIKLFSIVIIIGLVGFSQIKYYFFSGILTPRSRFVAGALDLAKKYFPFGAGFATFGSSAAAQHYSKIYYDFGFNFLRGMSPTDQLYLNDNYFQMILGQFGFVGIMIFILLLVVFVIDIFKTFFMKNNREIKVISCFLVGDFLISSIQSSYLAHYSMVALLFFFILSVYALMNPLRFRKKVELKEYL